MRSPKSSVAGLLLAGVLVAPGLTPLFTTLGSTLGLASNGSTGYQRDLRVWNNAADASANPAGASDPAFPGATGAALASWKAAKAWASDTPAAAENFDYDWQGSATTSNPNQNTISFGDTGCSGGTLAYTETPVNDGWRILVCESAWNWYAGTNAPAGGEYDLRGVLTHELGHALGLGHSQTANCPGNGCGTSPVMCSFICGDGVTARTIKSDDQAGIQSLYGSIPANKPMITAISGTLTTGSALIITGQQFAPTVNVKFTAGTSTNTTPINGVVTNVASTQGGTRVAVTIPSSAQSGNVIVWEPGSSLMSNAFPIFINAVPAVITSVSPPLVDAFHAGTVTLTGSGFTGASQVNFGGAILTPPAFTVVNAATITLTAPNATVLGPSTVTVGGANGLSAPAPFTWVETSPPRMTTSPLVFSTAPYIANFGGGANDTFVLIASLDPTTFTYQGSPILLNFLVIATGPLSPTGLGSFQVTIPPASGGVSFYIQVATVSDTTGQLSGVSAITSSTVIL